MIRRKEERELEEWRMIVRVVVVCTHGEDERGTESWDAVNIRRTSLEVSFGTFASTCEEPVGEYPPCFLSSRRNTPLTRGE